MQHHHPGSWYLPWGVPLQKMLAVPMHHPGAAVGFHQPPQATALQVPSSTQHQNYQHQIHPAALHHSSAALHQPIHPAAAAAMFTPLSLRTFINPSGNHLSLSPQQTMTSSVQAQSNQTLQSQKQSQLAAINLNVGVVPIRPANSSTLSSGSMIMPVKKVIFFCTHNVGF